MKQIDFDDKGKAYRIKHALSNMYRATNRVPQDYVRIYDGRQLVVHDSAIPQLEKLLLHIPKREYRMKDFENN